MKTVNIRQSRREFIDEHMNVTKGYYLALIEAFKLSAGKRWNNINYTYNSNGLTFLSLFDENGSEEIIYNNK